MTRSFLEDVPAARLTENTLRRMFELITKGVTDPKFQELVYSITHAVPGKDYSGEVRSIFNWVKQNIRYTRDPYGVELVQDPWTTINRARGDCDDMSILIGAMCEVMGNPARFVTVSTRADLEPCHVYPECFTRGRWTALDATVGSSSPGWKPSAGITDRRTWSRKDLGISGYDLANVEGLGMLDAGYFRQSVRPINLTPDIPSDVAHTYADLMEGEAVIGRQQPGSPRAQVARFADTTTQTGPGGIPYDGHYPIQNQRSYRDAWSFVPRNQVPIKLDPWGKMQPWKADWSKVYPQPNVPEEKFLMDAIDGYAVGMAGLGLGKVSEVDMKVVLDAIANDTSRKVASGKIDRSQAESHAKNLVDAVQTGDVATVSSNPHTKAAVMSVARKHGRMGGGGIFAEPSLSWLPRSDGDVFSFKQGVAGLGEYFRKGVNLGDLGDGVDAVVDAVQKDVTLAVKSGAVPAAAAPAAASKVIDAIHTGDSTVVNPKNTPHTHALLQNIKKVGAARTPATRAHHPVSAGTVRSNRMRASSTDYWEADPSVEWNPQFYGLGSIPVGARTSLYKKVYDIVRRNLPEAIRRAGIHPAHVSRVLGRRAPLQGLGQVAPGAPPPVDPATIATAAGTITNAVAGVIDPNDAAQINNAVNAGIQAIVGKAAPTTGISLAGWGTPLLIAAAIGGVAMLMTKKKGYRRNPGRRRRSGGRRGGKAIDPKWLVLGAAGVGAYMIFKKPAAPAVPGAPQSFAQRLISSALNIFKTPAGQAQVSSAATGISKLFSSGPSAPAPAPDQPMNIVTSLPDMSTPPSSTQQIITSIDTSTGASPDVTPIVDIQG